MIEARLESASRAVMSLDLDAGPAICRHLAVLRDRHLKREAIPVVGKTLRPVGATAPSGAMWFAFTCATLVSADAVIVRAETLSTKVAPPVARRCGRFGVRASNRSRSLRWSSDNMHRRDLDCRDARSYLGERRRKLRAIHAKAVGDRARLGELLADLYHASVQDFPRHRRTDRAADQSSYHRRDHRPRHRLTVTDFPSPEAQRAAL